MIVDVHAHYFPAEYAAFVRARGLTGVNAPERPTPVYAPPQTPLVRPALGPEDLPSRLAAMDNAGVGRQILSASTAPYFADRDDAVAAAGLINDAYAELRRNHPARFGFWASLPLPHVDASLQELERAFLLGAAGVVMQCFCLNETIARDAFEPLFAELDRRGSVVFLHPCQNGLCSHLINEWGLTICMGASMEDAVVAAQLIVKQIPVRYPRIRFVVPHFGGALPMLLERLDGQLNRSGLSEPPSQTARGFYYDTVGWGSRAALVAAVTAFGDTQLVPGSDWPFLLGWESYRRTFDHIRDSDLPAVSIDRILHQNVARLSPSLSAPA